MPSHRRVVEKWLAAMWALNVHELFPIRQLQIEILRQPVRQVEPQRLVAADKPHDARPLHAGRFFQHQQRHAAVGNRLSQQVRYRCFRFSLAHCVSYVTFAIRVNHFLFRRADTQQTHCSAGWSSESSGIHFRYSFGK